MRKVVIDTNVFISGILFGGNPQKILEAWLHQKFILCLSPELKAEILGKLERKFLLPAENLHTIEQSLDRYSEKYVPKKKVILLKDLNDNFLLALSEKSQADYLVSGDKQVVELKRYKNTTILIAKEFLDLV